MAGYKVMYYHRVFIDSYKDAGGNKEQLTDRIIWNVVDGVMRAYPETENPNYEATEASRIAGIVAAVLSQEWK